MDWRGVGSERHSSYRTGVEGLEVDAGTKMEGWRSGAVAKHQEKNILLLTGIIIFGLPSTFISNHPFLTLFFFPRVPGLTITFWQRWWGEKPVELSMGHETVWDKNNVTKTHTHNKKENVLETHTHLLDPETSCGYRTFYKYTNVLTALKECDVPTSG